MRSSATPVAPVEDVGDLERRGHALISEGHAMLSRAADLRTRGTSESWLPASSSPLGKRRTLKLAREGVIESAKVGRKVVIRARSLEAFLEKNRRAIAEEEDLFGEATTPRGVASRRRG